MVASWSFQKATVCDLELLSLPFTPGEHYRLDRSALVNTRFATASGGGPKGRHCEERSDEAIPSPVAPGLLSASPSARGHNDGARVTATTGEGGSRQIFIKIPPQGIACFDQRQLFLARVGLDLFLPRDGVLHGNVEFKPYQQLAAVARREARNQRLTVLPARRDRFDVTPL